MTCSMMKCGCLGLALIIPAEAGLKAVEFLHLEPAQPPSLEAIMPRSVVHLHASGDGEVPPYLHASETVAVVTTTAREPRVLAKMVTEGGVITYRLP